MKEYQINVIAGTKVIADMAQSIRDKTINDQRMKAVPPGPLPAGPPNKEMYMELLSEGTWSFNGVDVATNPKGSILNLWWNKVIWSKDGGVELPVRPVIDNTSSTSVTEGLSANQGRILDSKIQSLDTFTVNYNKDFPLKNYPTNSSFLDRLTKIRKSLLSVEVIASDVNTSVYTVYSIRKGSTLDTTIGIFKRSRVDTSIILGKYNYTISDTALGEKNIGELTKLKNSVSPTKITLVDYSNNFEITLVIDGSQLVVDEALVFGNTSDTDTAVNTLWKDFIFVDSSYKMKFAALDSDAFKKLVIGVNSPKVHKGQYVDINGDIIPSSSFSFKEYQVVKGSIRKIKIVGSARYSTPLYFAQFKSDVISSSSFLNGKKVNSSTLTPINEWVELDPETVTFIIGYANVNGAMDVVDISSFQNGGSPPITGSGIVFKYTVSDLGARPYFLNLWGYDYLHFIMYGQSLSEGNNPAQPVTTEINPLNLMAGTMPNVTGDLNITALNPIRSVAGRGESPIVTATHHIGEMIRRFINPNQLVIGNSCGQSSRSIEVLSKECLNYNYYSGRTSAGTNTYTNRFLNLATKTYALISGWGKTIACPAIIWMEGENNYTIGDQGLTVGTSQSTDKDTHKLLLLKLKNNMQADLMAIYGQSKPPMFFIYQTGRLWTQEKGQAITMAQIEFANENDDVILLNPVYPVPGMLPTSDHMSENGARWYGELLAKSMYEVLIKGKDYNAITLEQSHIVDRTTIDLIFKVPAEPLVIDTFTTMPQSNHGFVVLNNDVSVGLSSVSIINSNTIRIKMVSDLENGNVEISYGSQATNGKGNIRDSDSYKGMFQYTDFSSVATAPEQYVAKDSQGDPLYGKQYPLYNWLPHVYKLLTLS
ncbi:hypothetical protein [Sphingobacterium kitahiroshimense]|uniref:hypothetical protein n=1 Tax=Sphingobacterium kitahiroshimense TaxID=470446 RepID=UPI003209C88D